MLKSLKRKTKKQRRCPTTKQKLAKKSKRCRRKINDLPKHKSVASRKGDSRLFKSFHRNMMILDLSSYRPDESNKNIQQLNELGSGDAHDFTFEAE